MRRAIVYVIACVLVIVAGLYAVRLARPDDPYGDIRIQGVSSGASEGDARTEAVRWDSEEGRGMVDVREGDGVVRRYYMESDGDDGVRVWGGDEAPEERESEPQQEPQW